VKSALAYIQAHTVGLGITAAVIVAVGGFYYISSHNEPQAETMTVSSAPFAQEVSVSGKVVAARDVELGFSQGGRIARAYVRIGDRVAAGQVLAEIENGDLIAAVQQREAAVATQEAKLDALMQGTRAEEIAVAETDVANNAEALVQARSALRDELRDAYVTADDSVRNDVYQFVNNPRGNAPTLKVTTTDTQAAINLASAVASVESMLASWQQELAALESAELASAVANAQQYIARVSDMLATASDVLNHAQPSASVTLSQITGYSSDIAVARANIAAAQSALTSAVTAEKNAAAALASAERTLTLKKAGAIQADIDAQRAQIKAAEADLASARAQLAKTVIRAPFAGVVTRMDAKAGSIISGTSQPIALIGNDAYQVESYIPEVNIALVEVGDTARVTLDSYGESVVFDARLVSIDPAETIRDGVPTYRAILQFSGNDPRIRSGMSANIRITTDERAGVIAIPRGLVNEREGKKYVVVMEGERRVEREVTTGEVSSLGEIEILSGLSGGDVVVLPFEQ
jgi:HlyD family secretion protein